MLDFSRMVPVTKTPPLSSTEPPAGTSSMACWIAAVLSVTPSPTARYGACRTSTTVPGGAATGFLYTMTLSTRSEPADVPALNLSRPMSIAAGSRKAQRDPNRRPSMKTSNRWAVTSRTSRTVYHSPALTWVS